MRNLTVILASAIFATPAYAQLSQRDSGPIKGNLEFKVEQQNSTVVAAGEGNTVKNTVGSIKGPVKIQGNTKIKASQKNATTVGVGKNNSTANESGVIGGK